MPERRMWTGINSDRNQSSGHQRRRKAKDKTDHGDQLHVVGEGISVEMK